jgi:hypothetical protein
MHGMVEARLARRRMSNRSGRSKGGVGHSNLKKITVSEGLKSARDGQVTCCGWLRRVVRADHGPTRATRDPSPLSHPNPREASLIFINASSHTIEH